MIEQLLEYDTQLFLFLNNLGSPAWDDFWLTVTNKLTFIPLYLMLFVFLYKKYGLKAIIIFILVAAVMITFTDQTTNVFKRYFSRPRPCGEDDLYGHMRFIAVRCGKYGFFSGHSSNSMAAAIFIGLLLRPYYRHLILLLVLWSFLFAYSRIYLGVHYPLDIICGMTFGAISAVLFYKLTKYLLKRFIHSE